METLRALGLLIEAPGPAHGEVARALGLSRPPPAPVYQRVVASQRWPYASVYLGEAGMMGGDARDRIAGFRRALGLDQEQDPTECDHLAALLGLLADLCDWSAESRDAPAAKLLEEARGVLVRDHLASWIRPYLASFDYCGDPFYRAWATMLGEVMDHLEAAVPAVSGQDSLPAALRTAASLPDPDEAGRDSFVAALLAPVRSGIVIVRDDLVRLGRETGLACRTGERRYALTSFLTQAPVVALTWLAGHARAWRGRTEGRGPAKIAEWWTERAQRTESLLSRMASEAGMLDAGVARSASVTRSAGIARSASR